MTLRVLLVNLIAAAPLSVIKEAAANKRMSEISIRLDMPVGLLYLSSYAKQNATRKCEIRLLDVNKKFYELTTIHGNTIFNEPIGKLIEKIVHASIADYKPSIIGISVMFTSSHQHGIVISHLFRKYCPNAFIVGGGVQATNEYPCLLKNGSFDMIVRGEGEIPFSALIGMYEDGKKEYRIAGMVNKQDVCVDKSGDKAEMVKDLDSIPFPDYSLLEDVELYTNNSTRTRGTKDQDLHCMPLITTRGCPKRCSFCASHSTHGRRLRSRSLNNIYAEIEYVRSHYNINTLLIEDDLFSFNKQRTIAFCERCIESEWKLRIEFPNGLAIWTLDEEVVDKLVKSGMKVINLAVESGSAYVQSQLINKHLNLQHVRHIAEVISKYPDIESRSYYVIGFPGERIEHINETREFALSLQQDWSVFMIAMPLPGSDLYDDCIRQKFITRDNDFDSPSFWSTLTRDFDTHELTKEQIIDIQSDLNIHTNFLSNQNIRNGNYRKALPTFKRIVEAYPFHVVARYCLWKCYIGLNLAEKAKKEIDAMRHWIKSSEEAAKLYLRYKSCMDIEL